MSSVRYEAIIAVDFDDTIAKTNFPEILGQVPDVARVLRRLQDRGWYIIVNTCRSTIHEVNAVKWMVENGIPFNMVNHNHGELIDFYVSDCRKISADVYIDDKNLETILDGGINWEKIAHKLDMVEAYIFKNSSLNKARKCKSENQKPSLNQFVRSERFITNHNYSD